MILPGNHARMLTVGKVLELARRQGEGRRIEVSADQLDALKFNVAVYASPMEELRDRARGVGAGSFWISDIPNAGIAVEYTADKRRLTFEEVLGENMGDRRRALGLTRGAMALWINVAVAMLRDVEEAKEQIVATAITDHWYPRALSAVEQQRNANPDVFRRKRAALNAEAPV
jgi:hypothetical protein